MSSRETRARSAAPGRATLALPALALPAAMLLATLVAQALAGERTAETLFLACWVSAVFLPLAFLDSARRPVHAGLALAATIAVMTLPPAGGLRAAVVSGLLALSVLVLASRVLVTRPRIDLRTAAALAVAAAFVLHGHRLFVEGLSFTTIVLLVLLPAVAAVAASGLAIADRPGAGLAAVFGLVAAPQLAAEPWWVLLVCAAAASTASLGSGRPARLAQRSLMLLGAATLFAGSFPWLRSAPIATLAAAVGSIHRPLAETPVAERAVVLTQRSPAVEVDLSGARVSALVVDSYLTNGVDLACGRELATLNVEDVREGDEPRKLAKAPMRFALVAGRDSAEWAAGRPDVAARLACPAPQPWISWIPGAGRFLGQTTRARVELPFARPARHLRIERSADLPAETALAIFFVATQR
jgi:hypothetical protein